MNRETVDLMHLLTAPSSIEALQLIARGVDGVTIPELAEQTGKSMDRLEHTLIRLKHRGVINGQVKPGGRVNYWKITKPYYTLVIDLLELSDRFGAVK